MSEFSKRRKSEYAKAVAEAERETRFYVATHLKAAVPSYRIELDRRIAELAIAWRDMDDEQKRALVHDAIRKMRNFTRPIIPRPEKAPGETETIHVSPTERTRQIEALYAAMTSAERAEYDGRRQA